MDETFSSVEVVSNLEKCKRFLIRTAKVGPILLALFLVIYLTYAFVRGVYFVLSNKKTINSQWATYRCKPYVMPMAGWVVGPSSTNPAKNFVECSFAMNKSFFDILKQDFLKMFSILFDIVRDQQKAIQNIRNMTNYMRESLKRFARDIYQRMYAAYFRISSLFGVFMKSFEKLFRLLKSSYNVMMYGYYTMTSVWNGPIGSIARFFCFAPETPILMADGSYKRIKDIAIGDLVGDSRNVVRSIMKIDAKDKDDLYVYRSSVVVSGTHLVKDEDEGWVRIENSRFAEKFSYDYPVDTIYCLITDGSRITAGSYHFADYMETNDNDLIDKIQQSCLIRLNTGETVPMSRIEPSGQEHYIWALHPDTKVKTLKRGKKLKRIGDIKMGEKVAGGGVVGVLVDSCVEGLPIYRYRGVEMTGTQIVKLGEQFVFVRDIEDAVFVRKGDKGEIFKHICTENCLIELEGDLTVVDFEETDCEKLGDAIDYCVEKFLRL